MERIALNNRRRISKVCFICVFIAVMLSSAVLALALPKQGNGNCACSCYAPSGIGTGALLQAVTYDSKGYACGAFEGKTCNIIDSDGDIYTGTITTCVEASKAGAGAKVISIFPPRREKFAPETNNPPPKPITGGASKQ